MSVSVAMAGLVVAVIEIAGLAGTLALLVPIVLLLIVILRTRRPPEPRSEKATAVLRAIPSSDTPPGEAAPREDASAAVAEERALEAEPVAAESADWPELIRAAEAENNQAALASLYLSFARDEIAAGRVDQAADHLRSSVRSAAKSRFAAIQAEARLELAELARAAGDLTTACEHWQIARALFHDLKQKAELGETENLMRKHGCPTDWVLNDF